MGVLLFYVVSSLISLAAMAFWFLMIWDCVRRGGTGYWLTILIFLGPMGALIYFLINRPPLEIPGINLSSGPRKSDRIRQLRAMISRAPDGHLYMELGRLYFESHNITESRDALQKALEYEPDNEVALLLMGKILVAEGNDSDAIPFLEAPLYSTKDKDRLSDAARLLAGIYERRGDNGRALGYYEKLIACYPFSEARYNYGVLLEKEGKPAEAKAQMEAIVREADDLPSFSLKKEKEWIRKAEAFLRK